MWERFLRFAQGTLQLKQKTEENSADIAALQKQVEALTAEVQNLAMEFRHLKDTERQERENLTLCLENVLLRFERRLPGGPGRDDRYLTD